MRFFSAREAECPFLVAPVEPDTEAKDGLNREFRRLSSTQDRRLDTGREEGKLDPGTHIGIRATVASGNFEERGSSL